MFEKYYLDKDFKFGLYGYSPPIKGSWYIDDKLFEGEDFRTVERYKEYKDVGFNILLSQTSATYSGQEWETCDTKKVMDMALEAGIDKVILSDERIYWLTRCKDGLFGEGSFDERVYKYAPKDSNLPNGKKFNNEDELDDFVKKCLAPYKDHKAFYGVQFCDEPHYYLFKAIGQLYRSIKRVCPNCFIQCNLLPLDTLRWMNERYPSGSDLYSRQKAYYEMFLDETGADYLMYDDYPFSYAKENKINYFRCLQNVADVCKKRKVKFYFVAQSFSMNIGKNPYYYLPTEKEFRYQMNLLTGFGVKEFAFFTYWTKPDNSSSGENYDNNAAMITRDGKRTEMYYTVQKVIKELQDILPLVSKFEYVNSAYDICTYKSFLKGLDYCLNEKLDNVESFSTDSEAVMINELYNAQHREYLYRVVNLTDTNLKDFEDKIQTTTITFDKKVTSADVFINGKWETVAVKDGKMAVTLKSGESAYVLI